VKAYNSSGGLQKFGTQAEKARKVIFFKNGEINHKGESLLISDKKFKTLDQLKVELAHVLKLSMPVMKIYDKDLKLVGDLAEVADAGRYIAVCKDGLLKDKRVSCIV